MTKEEKEDMLNELTSQKFIADRNEAQTRNACNAWGTRSRILNQIMDAIKSIEVEECESILKVCGECVTFEKCRDEQGVVYHNSACHVYQVKTCGTCIDCDDCDMCLTANSPPCGSWRSNAENI